MQNCKKNCNKYLADLLDPIFVHLFAKTWTAGPTNLKFGMRINHALQKNKKITIFVGAAVLEANIFQTFEKARSSKKYLGQILKGQVRLVPTFDSHPAKSLLELELILL